MVAVSKPLHRTFKPLGLFISLIVVSSLVTVAAPINSANAEVSEEPRIYGTWRVTGTFHDEDRDAISSYVADESYEYLVNVDPQGNADITGSSSKLDRHSYNGCDSETYWRTTSSTSSGVAFRTTPFSVEIGSQPEDVWVLLNESLFPAVYGYTSSCQPPYEETFEDSLPRDAGGSENPYVVRWSPPDPQGPLTGHDIVVAEVPDGPDEGYNYTIWRTEVEYTLYCVGCPDTRSESVDFDWKVKPRTKDTNGDGVIDKYVAGGAQSATLEPQQQVKTVLNACRSVPAGTAVRWFIDSARLPANGNCRSPWFAPEGDYQVRAEAVIGGVSRSGTQTVSPEHHIVVGLGDSYGSGEGAPRGPQHRDKSYWDQKNCHRSAHSAQARAALKLEKKSTRSAVTFVHLACSGGTVDRGILGSFRGEQPQISEARSRTQGNDIDAVLLSIGGNDIGFSFIIEKCLFKRNCPLQEVPNPDAVGGDVSLHDSTQYLLSHLAQRYERVARCLSVIAEPCELGTNLQVDPARVFHTEYPDLTRVDTGEYCATADGISDHELAWADQVVANGEAGSTFRFTRRLQGDIDLDVSQLGLNTRILVGDVAFGWSPVDGINEASSTHGYCAQNHWLVRLDQSFYRQGDQKGAFHPNIKGQKAYGNLIAQRLAASM